MSNEILKFGDTATNILTQAEYAVDVDRNSGNIPGIARSKLVNKVLRQCAFISNGFAEYIATKTGSSVLDNNDSTALQAIITSAFAVTLTNPNYLFNSNFDYWQRGISFAVSVTNTYTADRFAEVLTGSTSTVARQSTAGTEAFNARYFKRIAVTSSVGTSNFNYSTQRIEDVRRFSGKQITLSFWAKADSARNMSVEIIQNFGTGGSPSAEVTAIAVQKSALTTSWQKISLTVTMPSISGKVLGTNENSYTAINFWYDAGATYNARTSSLGQQSGTFDLAQLKLEDGANVTTHILAGGSFALDLEGCQRYFEKSPDVEEIPGTTSTGETSVFLSSAIARYGQQFKVSKRGVPTVTFRSPQDASLGNYWNRGAANAGSTNSTATLNGAFRNLFVFTLSSYTADNYAYINWYADAEL